MLSFLLPSQPRPLLLSNFLQAGALGLSRGDCRCCSSHVFASPSRRRRRGPGRRRRRAGARRHRGRDAHRPVSSLAGFSSFVELARSFALSCRAWCYAAVNKRKRRREGDKRRQRRRRRNAEWKQTAATSDGDLASARFSTPSSSLSLSTLSHLRHTHKKNVLRKDYLEIQYANVRVPVDPSIVEGNCVPFKVGEKAAGEGGKRERTKGEERQREGGCWGATAVSRRLSQTSLSSLPLFHQNPPFIFFCLLSDRTSPASAGSSPPP